MLAQPRHARPNLDRDDARVSDAYWRNGADDNGGTSMNTQDSSVTPLAVTVSRPERVFPTLTPEQLSRIAAHGRRRSTTAGEVLVEVGDKAVPIFVVGSGEVQALRPTDRGETLIVSHHAGQFSGEANMISGRRALGRLRVSESGEVIQLDRQ